jgi:hypothetical protein
MNAAATATARDIQRALRLLESQRRASKAYYERHKEDIKLKSTQYWEAHKDLINERRRQRYALAHPPPAQPELR